MTREEAIRKLKKQKAEHLEEWVDFSGVAEAYDMAIEALEQPIIRCKDCKIRYTDRCGMFDSDSEAEWTEDNGFCQYGERKDP